MGRKHTTVWGYTRTTETDDRAGIVQLGKLTGKDRDLASVASSPREAAGPEVPLLPLVHREYISGSYAALPAVQLRSAGSQEVSSATIVSTI